MNGFDLRAWMAELRRFCWVPLIAVVAGLSVAVWRNSKEPVRYFSQAKMVVAGKINLDTAASYQENNADFLGTQTAIIQGDLVAKGAKKVLAGRGLTAPKSRFRLRASYVPQTAIFVLNATGTDPVYTQALLQASMESFFAVRQEMRRQRSQVAATAVSKELARMEQELDRANRELNDFQNRFGSIALTEDITATTAFITALTKRIADLRLEQSGTVTGSGANPSAAANAIPLDNGPASYGGNQGDGTQDRLVEAQQDLATQQAERHRLLKYLQAEHPKIKQLDSKIAEDKNLITSLQSQQKDQRTDQIASINREAAALQKEVEEKQARLVELNNNLGTYQRLKSQVDNDRESYTKLAAQLRSIEVGQRLDQEPIAILENASAATKVARSRYAYYWEFGLSGLVVGLIGVGVLSRLAPRFMTIEAVLRALHFPVIGRILRDPWIAKRRTVLDCTREHIGFAESFRHLRSGVLRRPPEFAAMQCLAVTSGVPREGKSLVATNLAIALAATNARTLLIDGDMRRGKIHQLLGAESGPGLAELITQEKNLSETLHETRMPHLYLMPCGRRIQNTTEYLLSFGLKDLRHELNAQFDYILIDTPPILATDDGVTLASYADATLFVVRLGFSRPQDSVAAVEELKSRAIRLSGLVVNSVPKHLSGRRFYNYYLQAAAQPDGKLQMTNDKLFLR
jgi:succinoglycan biosynthesis transport protein ExoP